MYEAYLYASTENLRINTTSTHRICAKIGDNLLSVGWFKQNMVLNNMLFTYK